MDEREMIALYNYDEFVPAKFMPLMQFDQSPPLGQSAPNFPLWDLSGAQTTLSAVWSAHTYTVVEFGSFT